MIMLLPNESVEEFWRSTNSRWSYGWKKL